MLRYTVGRTASKQLPIYTEYKRGGARVQTRIRKVDGDPTQLAKDLEKDLQIPEKDISVNLLTKHVIVRGPYNGAIKSFMERNGL